jgi:hypothetical protein
MLLNTKDVVTFLRGLQVAPRAKKEPAKKSKSQASNTNAGAVVRGISSQMSGRGLCMARPVPDGS